MLSQTQADSLIAMEKRKAKPVDYQLPMAGESLTIPIVSVDETEFFLVDVNRGKIRLTKCSYQQRYQLVNVLVRLDTDGPPHTNPHVSEVPIPQFTDYNGSVLPCPHLHLYVATFMDRWAIPAPPDQFTRPQDLYSTLGDFFTYCNIIEPPIIQRGLFG